MDKLAAKRGITTGKQVNEFRKDNTIL